MLLFFFNIKMLFYCSNWGTENDAEFKYHNGNSDPRGYGKTVFIYS